MCRAVYAVVVADTDSQARLRRAAGLEVQVTQMATSIDEVAAADPEPDVLIIHDSASVGAAPASGPALVHVGASAPDWADASIDDSDQLNDQLPSAITRALIARRSR